MMNQEVTPDDVPAVFSCRPWNASEESWDDFMGAVDRAYAQFVARRRRTMMEDQLWRAPDPDEQEP
jgi:hypothetical protein